MDEACREGGAGQREGPDGRPESRRERSLVAHGLAMGVRDMECLLKSLWSGIRRWALNRHGARW